MKLNRLLIILCVGLAIGCWMVCLRSPATATDSTTKPNEGALLAEIAALRQDISLLRSEIKALRAELAGGPVPAPQDGPVIEFASVPQAGGGSDSRGNIAGRVRGVANPEPLKIVLYAHTDVWYVQPLVDAPFTAIDSQGKWSNWTHLGTTYAALLVRSTFKPEAQAMTLPQVGGDVIAVAQVPASK